ncbi:MAG: acetoacetate decarboxylase family protein, partial [Cytophagales bacterium]|nr:acetoacetate decarboxylase family protein [Cytophaga sp.]
FVMPVSGNKSPVLMAMFECDYAEAQKLLPGTELFAVRLLNGKAVFIVTVVNYIDTTIGKYVEYSLAIACTRGKKSAPRLLPALFQKAYHTGQFVLDLPVSSEISVKGGKGIWGMPKHQASLDFIVTDKQVSAQYEKDGQFAFRIEMEKPTQLGMKVNMGATNYSHFRNLLIASYIYFESKAKINLFSKAKANLYIGDHPKVAHLRKLKINGKPLATLFMEGATGVLDDYFESWFITHTAKEDQTTEGLESVFHLTNSEEWLAAPSITDYVKYKI